VNEESIMEKFDGYGAVQSISFASP